MHALRGPPIATAARSASAPGAGVIVTVDAGWSTRFAAGSDPATGAAGFGASLGYAFANGLSLDARYDDLGVHLRPADAWPLQAGSIGARYALPFIVMPFAEARAGGAFDGAVTRFAAAVALGLEIPMARYLLIDLTARDWLVPTDGPLRSVVTIQAGLTVRFGVGGR